MTSKNPSVQVEAEVLETQSQDYQKAGETRTFRKAILRVAGKLLAFPVNKEAYEEVASQQGKKVLVELEFSTFGNNLEPRVAVSGIVTKK